MKIDVNKINRFHSLDTPYCAIINKNQKCLTCKHSGTNKS